MIRSNIGEGNPEGGRSKSCSGGAQEEELSKGGKKGEAAEPRAPVARGTPALAELSVVCYCCPRLLGGPQAGAARGEAKSERTALGAFGSYCPALSPTHPRALHGLQLLGHQPNPFPCPTPRRRGFPIGFSPAAMPSRVLLTPFEVYIDIINLGVIGIIRQFAFPVSPSPPY